MRFGTHDREDQLPPEMGDLRKRLSRLLQTKKRLDAVAEEEAAKARASTDDSYSNDSDHLENKEKTEERSSLEPTKLTGNKAKANITDPDSRIVKTRKGFIQGYNSQIMVTEEQFILATEVSQEGNDVNLLKPILATTMANLRDVGISETPKALAADA